ncbi:MAG: LexA repressor, repressor LexA [Parcubacteria group bacterium GW2011_GWC1_43_11b]|uniref:Repressor LexA n=1 Tax=Candidatus Vogelbacteria bacterium RIFOXYB1_FULL_42_16 TaxID=1802436 RepID=A0A1G2QC72_9BACT|nr:MAG: LexA repressor [Parcubacteria group bacterium GW2011_GWB1_42_9]KKS89550.1 MAG: LexA repressor, repressor LexA [Parcubacteria group bacterium GW2011_GWC1_43_11b]KKT09869.1 MAG: LexA repressor [Parcubacteria group bacterium GW2011_GWA1_43_21]OHA58165.1 MAG: repressor LexA [Candidatus Vogelbacteria bacterium RIFOXYB1_FULL_42_16]
MTNTKQVDLNKKELATVKAIRNSVVHFGTAPSTRQLMQTLGYKSTYSVMLIIDKLVDAGYLTKQDGKIKLIKDLRVSDAHARTVDIPLVGSAPCGAPFLAEQNIETMIPVSIQLAKPSHKYFLLRAVGDSMNLKNINDGDLVLVRQQNTAENGDTVVALIDDDATIKEFEKRTDVVLLKPKSKNKKHKPIILTEDFMIQGKIVATISDF